MPAQKRLDQSSALPRKKAKKSSTGDKSKPKKQDEDGDIHIQSRFQNNRQVRSINNYHTEYWNCTVDFDGTECDIDFLSHEHAYQYRKFHYFAVHLRLYARKSAGKDDSPAQNYADLAKEFERYARQCIGYFWNSAIALKEFAVTQARQVPDSILRDWEKIKYRESKALMKLKLTEDSEAGRSALRFLLSTGKRYIWKHVTKLECHLTWACDKDGNGENWFGILLMELRFELGGEPVPVKGVTSKAELRARFDEAEGDEEEEDENEDNEQGDVQDEDYEDHDFEEESSEDEETSDDEDFEYEDERDEDYEP